MSASKILSYARKHVLTDAKVTLAEAEHLADLAMQDGDVDSAERLALSRITKTSTTVFEPGANQLLAALGRSSDTSFQTVTEALEQHVHASGLRFLDGARPMDASEYSPELRAALEAFDREFNGDSVDSARMLVLPGGHSVVAAGNLGHSDEVIRFFDMKGQPLAQLRIDVPQGADLSMAWTALDGTPIAPIGIPRPILSAPSSKWRDNFQAYFFEGPSSSDHLNEILEHPIERDALPRTAQLQYDRVLRVNRDGALAYRGEFAGKKFFLVSDDNSGNGTSFLYAENGALFATVRYTESGYVEFSAVKR